MQTILFIYFSISVFLQPSAAAAELSQDHFETQANTLVLVFNHLLGVDCFFWWSSSDVDCLKLSSLCTCTWSAVLTPMCLSLEKKKVFSISWLHFYFFYFFIYSFLQPHRLRVVKMDPRCLWVQPWLDVSPGFHWFPMGHTVLHLLFDILRSQLSPEEWLLPTDEPTHQIKRCPLLLHRLPRVVFAKHWTLEFRVKCSSAGGRCSQAKALYAGKKRKEGYWSPLWGFTIISSGFGCGIY